MKKNLKWLGFGGALAVVMLTAMDLPAGENGFNSELLKSCMTTVQKDCEIWAAQGGGSEAPRGLRSDTRVELAIGESYVLTGRIEIFAGDPYLRINFRDQPWLANARRVKNPVYRINDSGSRWMQFKGKELTILATARYTAFKVRGQVILEIYLDPSPDAVVDALQRNRR